MEYNIQELWDNYKGVLYVYRSTRKRTEKSVQKIFEVLMDENFSKLMTDTKPQIQNSENTKHDRYQKIYH